MLHYRGTPMTLPHGTEASAGTLPASSGTFHETSVPPYSMKPTPLELLTGLSIPLWLVGGIIIHVLVAVKFL